MEPTTQATQSQKWPTQYVVGFMFTDDRQHVLLVQKSRPKDYTGEGRPEWQMGKINGIGGVLKPGEDALATMVRKFKAETGIDTARGDWDNYAQIAGEDYVVQFFRTFADGKKVSSAQTITDEHVGCYNVSGIGGIPVVDNLKWLLPLAQDTEYTGYTLAIDGNIQGFKKDKIVMYKIDMYRYPELSEEQIGELNERISAVAAWIEERVSASVNEAEDIEALKALIVASAPQEQLDAIGVQAIEWSREDGSSLIKYAFQLSGSESWHTGSLDTAGLKKNGATENDVPPQNQQPTPAQAETLETPTENDVPPQNQQGDNIEGPEETVEAIVTTPAEEAAQSPAEVPETASTPGSSEVPETDHTDTVQEQ